MVVKRAQIWSFVDGTFWTGMVSFGEIVTMLYLAKIMDSNGKLALFSTMPMAIGAIVQLMAPRVLKAANARNTLMMSIVVQIIGVAIVAWSLVNVAPAINALFLGLVLYWAGGMTAGPPWQEMMSRLIPENEHNRYFSGRSALLSIVNLATNLTVGLLLHERLDRQSVVTCLVVAMMFRMASLGAIWLHPKPAFDSQTLRKSGMEKIIDVGGRNSPIISLYGIAIFLFVFRFGSNMSGPFFNPYMLNHLHFSLMGIMILASIPQVTRIFWMSNWGAVLDKSWALEGVVICGLGIAIVPAMWTLSGSFGWIVGLQVWTGHVWAGFEILSVLLVQRMFPSTIMKALAVTFAAGTLGSALGGLAGGQLLEVGLSLPALFQLSSIVRFVAVGVLLSYLRSRGAFRFRTLRIFESLLQLISLEPTKKAASGIRATLSSLVHGKSR